MTRSETRLHSGEGTVGFEMVGDLFINLAFKVFRQAGYDRSMSVTVWVQNVYPFEEGDDRRAVDLGRGSQVESMASRRKMLLEILDYRGFISVSQSQRSGQLGEGILVLHGLYSVPKPFVISAAGCTF